MNVADEQNREVKSIKRRQEKRKHFSFVSFSRFEQPEQIGLERTQSKIGEKPVV